VTDEEFEQQFAPPSGSEIRNTVGEPFFRLPDENARSLFAELASQKELDNFIEEFYPGSRSGLVGLFQIVHEWHRDADEVNRIYAWLCAQILTEGKHRSVYFEYRLHEDDIWLSDIVRPMCAFRCSSAIMTESELNEYKLLPETFTVWRGGAGSVAELRTGFSWTTDKDIARQFAKLAAESTNQEPVIVWRRVRKTQLIAYFTEREEAEAVVWPSPYAQRAYRNSITHEGLF
jgi:hypothetical protein